ncbi:MAG: response regulator transcription factor [Micropruina sp.]|nr:response regulator transcription factor [Micropruina sp.]
MPPTPRPPKTRVLIVDDDASVRAAYRLFFDGQPGFVLVAEARDGAEGVELYAAVRPDVVLMDLQMPVRSGVEAITDICSRWPGACVVAMTTFSTREYVVAALRAGAAGYLLKDAGGQSVLGALSQAIAGDMPLSSIVRRELVATVASERRPDSAEHSLTSREVELVGWLAHGLTNQQIARRMELSEGSVKQYLSRVADKLHVVSRTQVLVRVIQLGIVDPMIVPSSDV